MKQSELHKLFDAYIMTSKVFDLKIRQVIKEELSQAINFNYSDGSSNRQINEIASAPPPIRMAPKPNAPRVPIDRSAIMPEMFAKVGLTDPIQQTSPQQITVPGTNGLVTIDAEDAEVYDEETEPVNSVMDNLLKGKSTGNKLLDEILTKDYSQYSKNIAKAKKK
jgi:hypothetical protein